MAKYVLIVSGLLFWIEVLYLFSIRRFIVSRLQLPPSEDELNKVATLYQFDLSSFKEKGGVHGYNLEAILKEVKGKKLVVLAFVGETKKRRGFLEEIWRKCPDYRSEKTSGYSM